MKYCTNCGERTSAKKICDSCGVKMYSTHNFCRWCGNALETNAKKCLVCGEKSKKDFILIPILCYILGIALIIGGLCVANDFALSGIALALFGLFLLPVIKKLVRIISGKKKVLFKTFNILRLALAAIFFVIYVSAIPADYEPPVKENKPTNSSVSAAITSQSEAIKAADKYISQNETYINQQIASKLGFVTFYTPKYGGKDAAEHHNYWNITYYGNMTGYIDKYQTDIENYKFTIILTVKQDGDISIHVYKD